MCLVLTEIGNNTHNSAIMGCLSPVRLIYKRLECSYVILLYIIEQQSDGAAAPAHHARCQPLLVCRGRHLPAAGRLRYRGYL